MIKTEWSALAEALKSCLNSQGTLQYDYDGQLGRIEPYFPGNCICGSRPVKRDFRTANKEQTIQAIDNWVKVQADIEDTCITTNAQMLLAEDDRAAKDKIVPTMTEEKRLLVRGVANLRGEKYFKDWSGDRKQQADALFDIAAKAIEEFQKTPTALILFPSLEIPDSRVLGGFYGSPWSTKNNRSLNLKFRMINPHFEQSVCTVSEHGRDGERRKIGVLFTYTNPW